MSRGRDCVSIDGRVLRSAECLCFWVQAAVRLGLVGLVAGQRQKAAGTWDGSEHKHKQSARRRRTAPACQPEYRPRYTPYPRHCIALHSTPCTITTPSAPPSPPPPTPPPPDLLFRRRVPSSLALAPPPPCIAHARYTTIAACNHHPMLRHNHSSFPDPPATLLAAPLATGIGFGHAACPAI
jgi:hypothetical protein